MAIQRQPDELYETQLGVFSGIDLNQSREELEADVASIVVRGSQPGRIPIDDEIDVNALNYVVNIYLGSLGTS